MKKIITTKQFLKDLKKQSKRKKELRKIKKIIKKLAEGENLSDRYREHSLKGDFDGFYECHIESDWLLIYKKTTEKVYLARTGTHSDLF